VARPSKIYTEKDKQQFNSLPDGVKHVLRGLSAGAVFYGLDHVSNYVGNKVRINTRNRIKELQRFEGFAFGLLYSIVFNKVLSSIPTNKIFKGLNPEHLTFFFNCFVCSQLRDNQVFSNDNILNYYSNLSKKQRVTHINEGFKVLINLGLLDLLDDNQIFNHTGQYREIHKRHKHYYKLSRKGLILMNEFIKIYEIEHKKTTGDIWSNDLVKLNTKIDENL
jgi:hypothetical protein